jgi:hypothetical protein
VRDKWYEDNRDLVKWGTLIALAGRFNLNHILQVLYYRPTEWAQIEIDGKSANIPRELIQHFRDVDSICKLGCRFTIGVLKHQFDNRPDRRRDYQERIIAAIYARHYGAGIVFLDPDTGLEPESGKFGPTHVTQDELLEIWTALRRGDLLVFYQHEDNKAGREWKIRKKKQFAEAIGIHREQARIASASEIALDVAFFFARKA